MADILFNTEGTAITTTGFRDEYSQFFRLLLPDDSDGYDLTIQEPIGWSDALQTLKRSERWHGFNYEILGETKLRFSSITGREDIVTAYNTFGFDAKIYLLYGTTYEGGEVIEYEGILDLMTKSDDGTFFSCTVKKSTLHDKIEPRFDTKLDLYATTDLDGGTIGSVTPTNIILHSKALQEKFLSEFTDNSRNTAGFFAKDTDIFIYPECSTPSISDIKTFSSKAFSAANKNPIKEDFWIWDSYSSGNYRFQINWAFTGIVTLVPRVLDGAVGRTPVLTSRQTRAFLVIERNKVRSEYAIGTRSFDGFVGASGFSVEFSGTLDETIPIERGDKIYIYAEVKYTYKGVAELKQTNYSFTNTSTTIQVDGRSENDRSGVNGLTVYNALRRSLWQIAGSDCLESDFFNTGCGKNYLITNGFSIRRFANKNPTLSFKEILESLDAIFFIGYEYNTSASGQKVKIKKADDFYSGGEILSFAECFDYRTEVASQFIYSSIEIGYNKFLDEGINYLDEYNTKHEYQISIEGHENRMSAMSSLIASGYALETTRREQFDSAGNDSTRYDDDCFIVAYSPQGTQTAVASTVFIKIFTSNFFQVPLDSLPSFFAVGVVIAVSGTVSNNRSYTISFIEIVTDPITLIKYYRVWVSESSLVSESTVTATFSTSGVAGEAEKNEPFVSVSNVISPETSYNLRITPKRMLYNRSKWLISTVYYKSSSALFKNTFFKMNGDLQTQFLETETCLLGDVNRSVLTEKNSVQKGSLGYGLPLFCPEWVYFNSYATRTQWNTIRKALRGILGGGKDYGYLTITNPDGVTVSGYPFEVSREENSGKVVVKMLRKA